MHRVALLTVLVWVARTVSGAILLTDTFEYAPGPLTTVSGGKWSTHSGTAGQAVVEAGRLVLSGINTEDVSAFLSGQPHDATGATNTFYASFILRLTTPPTAAGAYFAHFKGASATAFAARIWALPGADQGRFCLGLSSTSGSVVDAIHPAGLSLHTDYRVVCRFRNTTSITRLWIDPLAESDPAISTGEPPEGFNVVSFAFRQASGCGTLRLADLRVGTTFTDVVTNAPPLLGPLVIAPPRNQSAVEGTDVTFAPVVDGSPPLSVQWQFNGTDIPEATSPHLTLTNIGFAHSGFYRLTLSNAIDSQITEPAALNVFSSGAPAFSLLSYNAHGNGALNWTTNSWRVRAIGRQVQFLDPDIIAFQEVPVTNNGTAQMANFVTAFRPGYYVATNSTDDGHIRSVILSRYPILSSRSLLHGADLTPYGCAGTGFTRDLFEAEIAVPRFPQPLHVFTAHLKSGQDSNVSAKRSAEAGAISNFFVSHFLVTNGLRPYVLTGDLNEDLMRPPSSHPQSIERLIAEPVGLRLTTPLNAVDSVELTFSIQSAGGLTRRYDYILPCALLFTNVVSSQLFRTDLLTPMPPGLYPDDSRTASDHLPVLMTFANPYMRPPLAQFINLNGETFTCDWAVVPGQRYRLEMSGNLVTWTTVSPNVLATNETLSIEVNAVGPARFFRVRIQ